MYRLPWTNANKIAHDLLVQTLAANREHCSGKLLDLGCGSKPYQKLLGQKVDRWIGLDFELAAAGRTAADVFGSGLDLPFRDGTFDTVLCTQVLEHTPEPLRMMKEIARVLRPGGTLLLSAPQTGPLHEQPHDYYRYTCWGLRHLAHQARLEVHDTTPIGGNAATLMQLCAWHLNPLKRLPLGQAVHGACVAIVSYMGLALDAPLARLAQEGSTTILAYLLVAKRTEENCIQ